MKKSPGVPNHPKSSSETSKSAKPSRPKNNSPAPRGKTVRIMVRFDEEEAAGVEKQARAEGLHRASFIRSSAVKAYKAAALREGK